MPHCPARLRAFLCLLGATVVVAATGKLNALGAQGTPITVGVAAGPMFRPGTGGQSLGPTVAIQLGKQIGPKAHLQVVFEGAWRHPAQDVTVTSRCSEGRTCLFLGDSGDREERLAAALELLLYDHPGSRGGYVVGGFGLARYAAGADRSGTKPAVHGGLGISVRVGPTSLFTEARLAKVFDAGPFPGWTLAALGGIRLPL